MSLKPIQRRTCLQGQRETRFSVFEQVELQSLAAHAEPLRMLQRTLLYP